MAGDAGEKQGKKHPGIRLVTRRGVMLYEVRYRTPAGRIREFTETLGEAKTLHRKRIAELSAGVFVDPRTKPEAAPVIDDGPTFSAFASTFLKDHPGKRRSDHYDDQVKQLVLYFGEQPIRKITRAELDRYRVHLETTKQARRDRPLAPRTVIKRLRVLGRMFRMAHRWGVIDTNPAADLEKPTTPKATPRYLTKEQYEAAEAAAPPAARPMMRLAVQTGMRLGEVVRLRWDAVDYAAKTITVDENTKTGARTIPVGENVVKLLKAQHRNLRSPFVFTAPGGGDYTGATGRDWVSKVTSAALRAVGIESGGFHLLRHTAASWLVQKGVPLYQVQTILGHSTPAMTMVYAHLAPGHLAQAVAVMESIGLSSGPGLGLESQDAEPAANVAGNVTC